MPIYAVNAQNVTAAFRQVAPELDIVDICMNGSELGASIFHERLEQLTHEQPQLRFGCSWDRMPFMWRMMKLMMRLPILPLCRTSSWV